MLWKGDTEVVIKKMLILYSYDFFGSDLSDHVDNGIFFDNFQNVSNIKCLRFYDHIFPGNKSEMV